MEQIKISEPFPLERACNLRELGGYITTDGKTTKRNRLLRSDSLHALSDNDKAYLYEYGVRCIIDLRSDMECAQQPCSFGSFKDLDYVNFPMFDQVQSEDLQGVLPESMGQSYIDLLKNSQEMIAKVMKKIIEYPDDCVVFFCMAGKDRTGTIAMLILLLCDVAEEIVIADYAVSRKNLEPLISMQRATIEKMGIEVPDYVFDSEPSQMKRAIDFIMDSYGSITAYLKSAGLTGKEINDIKERLL